MLRRGLRRLLPKPQPDGEPSAALAEAARLPAGIRLYAIGDVHGCIDQLNTIIDFIETDARSAGEPGMRAVAVFLGDYVDRGPDSRAVLERLASLASLGTDTVSWRFLAGNHEAAMQEFLEAPVENAAWLAYGGPETLASYGILPPVGTPSRARLREVAAAFKAALPAHHLRFLQALEPIIILGDYALVHAGVRPNIPLERQKVEDLLWIREAFLDHAGWHGKRIIHGHTVEAEPVVLPWRIGIDTGAYASGRLCCLVMDSERMHFELT